MTAASTIISGADMTDKIDQMTEAKAALRKSVEIMKRTHGLLGQYRDKTHEYIDSVNAITRGCRRCHSRMVVRDK